MAEGPPIRHQGEVVEWSDEKQCGFIRPRGSGPSDPLVFVSAAAMATRKRLPEVGSTLVYELVSVPESAKSKRLRTRLRAEHVTFDGEDVPPGPQREVENWILYLAAAYLLAVSAVGFIVGLSWFPAGFVLMASSGTFATYAWDKLSAERQTRRVPEHVLHVFELGGGWPGAALAQKTLRHKTRKAAFRAAFYIVVVLNVLLSIALLSAMASR